MLFNQNDLAYLKSEPSLVPRPVPNILLIALCGYVCVERMLKYGRPTLAHRRKTVGTDLAEDKVRSDSGEPISETLGRRGSEQFRLYKDFFDGKYVTMGFVIFI